MEKKYFKSRKEKIIIVNNEGNIILPTIDKRKQSKIGKIKFRNQENEKRN